MLRKWIRAVPAVALVTGMVAMAPSRTNAQDGLRPIDAAAMQRARQDAEAADARAAIERNRAGVVSQLMSRWSADIGGSEKSQVGWSTRFANVDAGTLFKMTQAATWDDVVAASLGITTNQLGNPAQDLVFNALTPCRVMDTRFGTGPYAGPFASGQTVSFYVTDALNANGHNQGGAASCGYPFGVGSGVALNITILAVGSSGDVKVFPFGATPPNASIVNFSGFNPNAVANAADVANALSNGTNDVSIQVEFSSGVHIIVDIIGYFAASHATSLDTIRLVSAGANVGNGSTFNLNSPACTTGYALTGGGFSEQNTSTGHDVWASQPTTDVTPPTYWNVSGKNESGATQNYAVYAVCNRVPGR